MTNLVCILLVLSSLSLAAADMPKGYDERVADAIFKAENSRHYPYGIIAKGRLLDEATARKWCLNTIRNNWTRWQAAGAQGDYLTFLAKRYAPTKGATNDPTGLNKNWLKLVRHFLHDAEQNKLNLGAKINVDGQRLQV